MSDDGNIKITAYLLNEMTKEEKSKFEAEIMQNEGLRAAVDEQRLFMKFLNREFSKEPLPQLDSIHRAAINEKLYGEKSVSVWQKILSPRVGFSFATMSVVVVAILKVYTLAMKNSAVMETARLEQAYVPPPAPAPQMDAPAAPAREESTAIVDETLSADEGELGETAAAEIASAPRAKELEPKQAQQKPHLASAKKGFYTDANAHKILEKSGSDAAMEASARGNKPGAGGTAELRRAQPRSDSDAEFDDTMDNEEPAFGSADKISAKKSAQPLANSIGKASGEKYVGAMSELADDNKIMPKAKKLGKCLRKSLPELFSQNNTVTITITFTLNFGPDGKLKDVDVKNIDKEREKVVACSKKELAGEVSKPLSKMEIPITFRSK